MRCVLHCGTHSKIRLAANVCLDKGVDKFTCYAKVTQFDLPFSTDQDVGGLDVWRTKKGLEL